MENLKTLENMFDYLIEDSNGSNTIIGLDTIVYGTTGERYFVGQYGSMNCYDYDYPEFDYVYRLTLSELIELIEDYAEPFTTWNGYEEYDEFISSNPSKDDIKKLLDSFNFKENQAYDFEAKIMDLAQAYYERHS